MRLRIAIALAVTACGGSSQSSPDAGGSDGGGSDAGSAASCASLGPQSADLYVATDGQDAWSGTLARPNADASDGPTTLAAIQTKVATLQPGRATPIVVFVEDGTYPLATTWTLTTSGTADAPVIYAAAPGATPVLSGGVAITGWSQTTLNGVAVWRASAAGLAPFSQLWVAGTRRFRPTTTPNGYLYNANAANGDQATYTSFYFANNDIDPTWHDLGNVEIAGFENWTMPRMRLAGADPTTHIATLTGSTNLDPAGQLLHGFVPGHRYIADNVMEALKLPGQWYLDQLATPQTLYYIPQSGEDVTSESIIAPQLQTLVSATGVQNVTLRGLTFSHSSWTVGPQGWKDSQTESDPTANAPAAVTFDGTVNVVLDSDVFSHLSAIGVEIVGNAAGQALPDATTDCTTTFANQLVNSEITDTGGSGVRIGRWATPSDSDANVTQCVLVQNNVVSGVGRFLVSGNGIFVGSSHHITVRNNDVSDTYTYAIDVGASYGSRPNAPYVQKGVAHDQMVDHNHVFQVGQGVTSDIGGIYTATGGQTGNVVQGNVVHDITHDPGNAAAGEDEGYGGWGLYNDQGSSNVIWQNNLVYRCSQECMHVNFAANAMINNNIFAYGSEGDVGIANAESHLSFTFNDNIVYWDAAATSGSIWQWGDFACPLASPSDCFAMSDNLYVEAGGTPEFVTADTLEKLAGRRTVGTPQPPLMLAQWQALGEDVTPSSASFALSFGTAASPSFDLPATLPTAFTPFDPTLAGRSCAVLQPPAAPAGFPVQAWPGTY